MDYIKLGAELRKIRTLAGLQQVDVADRVGVNRSSISNIEAGRHKLSVNKLSDYVEACGYKLQISMVLVKPREYQKTIKVK